jgi:hypothetical protein
MKAINDSRIMFAGSRSRIALPDLETRRNQSGLRLRQKVKHTRQNDGSQPKISSQNRRASLPPVLMD